MKVVCLEKIRRMRSPYERMPYVPRSAKRYVVSTSFHADRVLAEHILGRESLGDLLSHTARAPLGTNWVKRAGRTGTNVRDHFVVCLMSLP